MNLIYNNSMMVNEVQEAESALKALYNERAQFRSAQKKRLEQRFVGAGGCERCRGRGWIVTWDTMDSLSGCYAEYGNCPNENCTAASRLRSGLDLSVQTKYDRLKGTDLESGKKAIWTEEEINCERILNKFISFQEKKLSELKEKWTIRKGVEVTLARKTRNCDEPVGTVGIVFWIGRNSWGTLKLGVKKADGSVFWTNGNSIFISNPEVKLQKDEIKLKLVKVSTSASGKAYSVRTSATPGKNLWIPASACNFISDEEALVKTWWAEQNDLLKK